MFKYLKTPKNYVEYTLMKGVTDFGNLAMYDLYESGYNGLYVISRPRYMELLAERDPMVKQLLDNYCHILEYEFRGLDGLGDVTGETQEISNGNKGFNIITKITSDNGVEINMKFLEKSGAVITRFNELFLKGIKDEHTEARTYYGLIEQGILEPGYENEVFTLLYYNTDSTYRKLERATLLLNVQPTKAETSIYVGDKFDINFKEISVPFNCFPVVGDEVNRRTMELLNFSLSDAAGPKKLILNSDNFKFTGIDKININAIK